MNKKNMFAVLINQNKIVYLQGDCFYLNLFSTMKR